VEPRDHLDELIVRYPALKDCAAAIEDAYRMIVECCRAGGKLLVCGNGGSAADADHIVGELMKGFLKRRALPEEVQSALRQADPELGPVLAARLQGAVPAIALSAQSAVATAFANDVDPTLVFAQLAAGYGNRGDVLLGISTSGNAQNVIAAFVAARAKCLRTIGLSGASGGKMKGRCDLLIAVPATKTLEVQELHLPVYHCLCAMIEECLFGD
jgi:D-sedoheptulose 7-phosphate isomerase